MNNYTTSVARKIGDLHLYANGTTGDDDNNGLTELTPKKTLVAISALVPEHIVQGTCHVHLNGTFDLSSNVEINSVVHGSGCLIVDGGTALVEIAATQAADVSSVWTIGKSTLGLTTDQYAGYWVEILDGAAAGQIRTIFSHTATTYTVVEKFSVDPGNANFRIVRPATTITCSGIMKRFTFACDGKGIGVIQGLYFSGSTITSLQGSGNSRASGCIIDSAHGFECSGTVDLWLVPFRYTGFETFDALLRTGFSVLTNPWVVSFYNIAALNLSSSVFLCDVVITGCRLNGPGGCRFKSIRMFNTSPMDDYYSFYYFGSSYHQKTLISGAAGVGLRLDNCIIQIDSGGLVVNNCGSHGIELRHSFLEFISPGIVSGSGNAGAGIYVHSNSTVQFPNGQTPTLTGTIGDTTTDGTTEASTWAAIDAGTPVADTDVAGYIREA
jgi:hypothetical protein